MKLCVALDNHTMNDNINLVKELKEFNDIWLKVGLRSFIRDGKDIINGIKDINPKFKIFLDLKLYDIPNTMADASESISGLGIDMFNIHASSGVVAMQTVMDRMKKIENRPIVLAVTALTSFDNNVFKDVYNEDIETKATKMAKESYNAGLDGVVCSVYESNDIKSNTSSNFITLTPGIRPFGEDSGDQKRVANIECARQNMSDFIVVGRPIYQNSNPKDVVKRILEEI
jgi:orotidine-5'-phosphate decarboxylase